MLEVVDEPIDKQPPVRFGTHAFGLHSWLSTKANVRHNQIKTVL
jgi:hypothetical protein